LELDLSAEGHGFLEGLLELLLIPLQKTAIAFLLQAVDIRSI
jgi:hypothetical protein